MKQADLTTTCVERAKEMLNVLPTEAWDSFPLIQLEGVLGHDVL